MKAVCSIPNCRRSCAAAEPFCTEHRGNDRWPAPVTGPDDPRLLSVPQVIERLRARAIEAEDPLDPISVSRRVLQELLRGYDALPEGKGE